jgi:thiamine biosynthesis protein ThiS
VRNPAFLQYDVAMAEAIHVHVNGETKQMPPGTSVRALLDHLGLNPGRVAIEYNLEILPKTQWEETRVVAGDRLEIVQFVGGG